MKSDTTTDEIPHISEVDKSEVEAGDRVISNGEVKVARIGSIQGNIYWKRAEEMPVDGTKNGLFVEIDEDDPFEKVELKAITEDGVGIKIGEISEGVGRYELKKVGDRR